MVFYSSCCPKVLLDSHSFSLTNEQMNKVHVQQALSLHNCTWLTTVWQSFDRPSKMAVDDVAEYGVWFFPSHDDFNPLLVELQV